MVEIYSDQDEFAAAASLRFTETVSAAIAACGWAIVALSGGSTPAKMYGALLDEEVDWQHVHFFWSDEREVAPTDAASNFKLAHDLLLSHVDVPAENVHRVCAELGAEAAAAQYEREILETFATYSRLDAIPAFELIFLGLGDDGHTASLFPGTAALAEARRLVVSNRVPQLKANRITFTLPLINAAHEVVFLVSGHQKAARVKEILGNVEGAEAGAPVLPAALVDADRATWMLDAQAAGML
jgi:6-phosphogluconolactonase